MHNNQYIIYLINAKSNSNILFYGYTSIINRLSIDIIRIKNGIVIYNFLNKNIVKLIPYTSET
jgi:hypothetical protein